MHPAHVPSLKLFWCISSPPPSNCLAWWPFWLLLQWVITELVSKWGTKKVVLVQVINSSIAFHNGSRRSARGMILRSWSSYMHLCNLVYFCFAEVVEMVCCLCTCKCYAPLSPVKSIYSMTRWVFDYWLITTSAAPDLRLKSNPLANDGRLATAWAFDMYRVPIATVHRELCRNKCNQICRL